MGLGCVVHEQQGVHRLFKLGPCPDLARLQQAQLWCEVVPTHHHSHLILVGSNGAYIHSCRALAL